MLVRVAPGPASGDGQKAAPTAVTQPWRRLTPARPRTWRAALLLAASCLVIGVKVVSTAAIMYLSYIQVVMYAAEPVLMDTVMAASPLPALTLCPRRPPAHVYNASVAALRAGNISTGKFVQRLRPDPARLLRACTICDITAEHVSAVRVHHGPVDDETLLPHCVTVRPRPEPLSEETRYWEHHAWLEIAVEPAPAPHDRWTHLLLVHPADQDVSMPGNVYRAYERPSSQIRLRPGTIVALPLAMEGWQRFSRRGAPCGVTTQRQWRSCTQQELAEAAGCRAVWMDAPEVSWRPLCPLGSQAALREKLRSDWQQRVVARCGGPTNCRYQQVTLREVPLVRRLPSRPDTIRLRVSWPPLMSVTRERLALTGGDVASFIGGLVGLFSGLSVFSVLDAALTVLHSLFTAQRRHHGDTQ